MNRKPIGLTVPYREVGYKEKSGWVDLTEQELSNITRLPLGTWELMLRVQAKLKEKNEKKK